MKYTKIEVLVLIATLSLALVALIFEPSIEAKTIFGLGLMVIWTYLFIK